MGLDISCRCGYISFRVGSYTYFHNWRKDLCKLAKISLKRYTGLLNDYVWLVSEDDPFFELLNHSDCDGKLSTLECRNLLEDFNKYLSRKNKILFTLLEDIFTIDFWKTYEKWHKAILHCVVEDCELYFR